MIKGIILDLDNTIYPVASIGKDVFSALFDHIDTHYAGQTELVKKDIMRIPFQRVASHYDFSPSLTQTGLALLKDLTYDKPMKPFEDYAFIRTLKKEKYLVTSGFTKLQESKIIQLGIADDFKRIFIVDPMHSPLTKKDIFQIIIKEEGYKENELMVVGDDPDSELLAAHELGIPYILYSKQEKPEDFHGPLVISSFSELAGILEKD